MEREPSTTGSETTANVVWFTNEACRDVSTAGGKGASLARMTADGLPVPPGFVIPSHVFETALDTERALELARKKNARELQTLVARSDVPTSEVSAAYENLIGQRVTATNKLVGTRKVAVRSSAVAEDSEAASRAILVECFGKDPGEPDYLEPIDLTISDSSVEVSFRGEKYGSHP